MIDKLISAFVIAAVAGCASFNSTSCSRGETVRVTAVAFSKADFDSASQSELIGKWRRGEARTLWSHIVSPDGGVVENYRSANVVTGYRYSTGRLMGSGNNAQDKRKTYESRNVGERIRVGKSSDNMLGVECEFSFVEEVELPDDEELDKRRDIVHSGKIVGSVPVDPGDHVIGSVAGDSAGSNVIVVFISE